MFSVHENILSLSHLGEGRGAVVLLPRPAEDEDPEGEGRPLLGAGLVALLEQLGQGLAPRHAAARVVELQFPVVLSRGSFLGCTVH